MELSWDERMETLSFGTISADQAPATNPVIVSREPEIIALTNGSVTGGGNPVSRDSDEPRGQVCRLHTGEGILLNDHRNGVTGMLYRRWLSDWSEWLPLWWELEGNQPSILSPRLTDLETDPIPRLAYSLEELSTIDFDEVPSRDR